MASKVYDVVIVGSGAAGGTLSAHLARQGVNVALVEGGPKVNTRTDFNTHAMPFQFPDRHIPTMKPGKQGFESERSRGIGGKTLTWNAVAWRLSQRDFKGRVHDGAGEDWPLDYKDMEPYYTRIEREVGVCGNRDGLEDLPDGEFLPPVPMKCSDLIVQRGAAKLGVKVIHVRKSTLSRPQGGRPSCHFCGNCMAGCDVVAKYNSADVHIVPAMRGGHLEVLPNSVVREVVVSNDNRVTGVRFVNRETKAEGEVQGKVVVVACACVQSVSLLMMSKSRLYPNGLGNSSGHLGKNFIPHFTGGVQCFLKDLMGKPAANDEGFLDHAYVPSFMHNRKRGYARSFGVQFNYQNRRSVGWARDISGFGKDYKQAVKDRYPAFLTFSPYGEMLPNAKTYVDLDYDRKDAYGLPSAVRHVTFSDNDWKIFKDMTEWSKHILETSGAEILAVGDEPRTNHELGGCRMGTDPKTSVLNKWCQSHDVKNLFVVDGSVFPSASEKNPTHTIMALAARTADYIADNLKKENSTLDRRDALKIIGAIGTTCAFPFSADELYGQHDHGSEEAAKLPAQPAFFTTAEFETVKRLADLIIPRTDTPGAVDAGVPSYIDYVVNSSPNWKKLFREGLAGLDRHGKRFVELTETQQIAMLTPLASAADKIKPPLRVARTANAQAAKKPKDPPLEVQFFKAFKSMTADGYFTSKAGLVETLGYKGNTVLSEFPTCIHEH